jgi:hypothetical protein
MDLFMPLHGKATGFLLVYRDMVCVFLLICTSTRRGFLSSIAADVFLCRFLRLHRKFWRNNHYCLSPTKAWPVSIVMLIADNFGK